MNRFLVILCFIVILTVPVRAYDLTAPSVPEHAEKFMPDDQTNFADGLLQVLRDALLYIRPDLKEAAGVCIRVTAIAMIVSLLRSFPGASEKTVNFSGCIGITLNLLNSTGSLINLASSTVVDISHYGKLLLPVITAAMASQGSISTSAALYAGTAFFDALLTSVVEKFLTPLVYFFLLLAVACGCIGEDILKKMKDTLKSVIVWCLKTILYIYTGYIGITGIVSGTTDAATLKATKLAISGMVPVIGGILSDASEAIIISAGTVKNTAGVYGLFAILALWIGPFFKLGIHYLLLKATAGICSIFSTKPSSDLIQDFTAAHGLLLAMIGTNCLMLLISIVCFMRGVG